MGDESPPADKRAVVSPPAPSPRLLDPAEMRNLMTGGVVTPTRPGNTAPPAATTKGQRRAAQVTFSLPEDPSHATLLEKLREQARAQEYEDVLIDFMQNQGKEKPQNAKEFGEWLSRAGEPVAVLAMVH